MRIPLALRNVLAPALELARRRGRRVAWTHDFMGWGNQALGWFWAWRGRSRGEERLTLRTAAMARWLDVFPAARALTVAREDVRFLDQRLWGGREGSDTGGSAWEKDWTWAEQQQFMTEVLWSSPQFAAAVAARSRGEDTVVVNVRRGDYYDPEHIDEFGFDIAAYVALALSGAEAQGGRIQAVHVVSDDIDWCRRHLPVLERWGSAVTFCTDKDPVDHLAALAGARRLVLANSTFSYWGGYLSTQRHGRPEDVWAPGFFMASCNGGRAWLLHDGWSVVDDVPGGWQGTVAAHDA